MRSYNPVVLDSNRNGLSVAETVCWGVAARARIVVVEPGNRIKPEHPSYLGALWVELSS
jgi:hypothetical protein